VTNRLDGKVALIFGASDGIGRATAELFASEGAKVVGADLNEAKPIEHGSYEHRQIDATDETAVGAFVADALSRHGTVDVAFMNVGGHVAGPLAESTVDDLYRMIKLNLLSAYLGARAVLPTMLRQKSGSIICTSSNGGVMGRPSDPLYNASKHGVIGLVRSIAVAHAHEGIRANAIAPGPIATPLLGTLVPDGHDLFEPDIVRAFVASTPAARLGRPEEVAAVALFLAGDEARFVNGVTLPIDGAKSAGALPGARYSQEFDLGADG
jgi:NAD(P)-dependent dehydrogenase (short-subunit alcohol dehydrogenase family)